MTPKVWNLLWVPPTKAQKYLQGLNQQSNLVRSNLYLRNLDSSCSDEELKNLFKVSAEWLL